MKTLVPALLLAVPLFLSAQSTTLQEVRAQATFQLQKSAFDRIVLWDAGGKGSELLLDSLESKLKGLRLPVVKAGDFRKNFIASHPAFGRGLSQRILKMKEGSKDSYTIEQQMLAQEERTALMGAFPRSLLVRVQMLHLSEGSFDPMRIPGAKLQEAKSTSQAKVLIDIFNLDSGVQIPSQIIQEDAALDVSRDLTRIDKNRDRSFRVRTPDAVGLVLQRMAETIGQGIRNASSR
jgi:hypothetical protein